MNKNQASLAIGLLTLIAGASVLGRWAVIAAALNAVFVHEFLTLKGQ